MPSKQFERMREIIAAPSPVSYEAAMTYGVIKPYFESFMPQDWAIHQFKGNASIVLDTHPDDKERTSVMIVGHADKIRLQVRKIDDDGKIWINSDSFLPGSLIGHEVTLYARNPENLHEFRTIRGGTIEAVGAIHFADAKQRSGDAGIKPEHLYLELQTHGNDRKEQITKLGIRAGDPILLDRPIKRGFSQDTFYGAYLDNGLGCFLVAELAKLIADKPLKNLRILFAIATHEEIGRCGSAVMAGELRPDILIAADVNHDLNAAPNCGHRHFNELAMAEGFTITNGAITSEYLNTIIETTCKKHKIPYQMDFSGRDTGTDAMASVLAGVDSAAVSIGFPIRNMHTISESGHTRDILSAIHATDATLRELDGMNKGEGLSPDDLKNSHENLSAAKAVE